MPCGEYHTAFQPTDEQWRCPKCGANHDRFYIDEPLDGAEDCEKLHKADGVYCMNCEVAWTGDRVSKLIAKKLNQVTCPTCKGHGTIDARQVAKKTKKSKAP